MSPTDAELIAARKVAHPMAEMIATIERSGGTAEALFDAIDILERAGGYVCLPLRDGFSFRPDLAATRKAFTP